MKRAYPINEKGEQIGEVRAFTDLHWERLSKIKNLRWKLEEKGSQVAGVTDIIPEPKPGATTLFAKSKNKPKSKQSE